MSAKRMLAMGVGIFGASLFPLTLAASLSLRAEAQNAPTAPPVDARVVLSKQAVLEVIEKATDAEDTERFLDGATFFEPLDQVQLHWLGRSLGGRGEAPSVATRVLDHLETRARKNEPCAEPVGRTAVSLEVARLLLAEAGDPDEAVWALNEVDFLFPIDTANVTELVRATPGGGRGAVVEYLERRAGGSFQDRREPTPTDSRPPLTGRPAAAGWPAPK